MYGESQPPVIFNEIPRKPKEDWVHHIFNKHNFVLVIVTALVFWIVSQPVVYKWTNKIVKGTTDNGKPTTLGVVVHSLVAAIVITIVLSFVNKH